jgi:hypothetical protein
MQSTIILDAHRRILSQHLHRRGCWKSCAPHWPETELELSELAARRSLRRLQGDDLRRHEAGNRDEAQRRSSAKWRLKCRAVAGSLEEAGDKLFTSTCFPKSQWKSIRTSNAIERLHEKFKRRIKTQTVLPPELVEGGGNLGDIVLGFADFWSDHSDHNAQGGRLAKPRREAFRSNH